MFKTYLRKFLSNKIRKYVVFAKYEPTNIYKIKLLTPDSDEQ